MEMLLEPEIVAKFWIRGWAAEISFRERELNSWVSDLLMTAMWKDAEYSWDIVEAIHSADSTQIHVEVFAAGPVEDLLTNHGETVIDRIESKARTDQKFAQVLGGVWKSTMSDEIWNRIKVVRDVSTWADPRESFDQLSLLHLKSCRNFAPHKLATNLSSMIEIALILTLGMVPGRA